MAVLSSWIQHVQVLTSTRQRKHTPCQHSAQTPSSETLERRSATSIKMKSLAICFMVCLQTHDLKAVNIGMRFAEIEDERRYEL